MSISSLSSNGYASLLNSVYGSDTSSGSASNTDISAFMSQLESTASTSVTLNSSNTTSTNPIYNAQGLLQQINAAKLSNDKILFGDNSSSDSSSNSGLPSELAGFASQLDNTSQTNTAKSSLDLNANWTTVLKSNPSMVPVLVQNQTNQTLISMFDTQG